MMKPILFVLSFFALSVISAYSQNTQDSIIVKEHLFGNSYYQKGTEIKKDQVFQLLEARPELAGLVKSSNSQKTIGWVMLVGGLSAHAVSIIKLIFYYHELDDIDRRNSGTDAIIGKPGFDVSIIFIAGAGVALDLIGLSFIESGNTNFRQALKKFNKAALHSENGYFDSGIKPYFSYKDIGISYQF